MAGGAYTYREEAADGFIVEVYLPKRLGYLSKAYEWLREELESRNRLPPRIYGFSIYEVAGAFTRGDGHIDDEQTMVIRVFFDRRDTLNPGAGGQERKREEHPKLNSKVNMMLKRLASISSAQEKELWAMRVGAHVYKLVRERR